MTTKDFTYDLKTIKASEHFPLVLTLLSMIEKLTDQLSSQAEMLSKQTEVASKQAEKIDELLNEIRQLKKLSKKPKIRASSLGKDKNGNDEEPPSTGNAPLKRPGSAKRSKHSTLKIDREEIIRVENIPAGSIRKGYQSYLVQDLMVKSMVTKYRLERWQLPDGRAVTASLPKALKGYHFGPTLRAYILHQHHHQCVTQPLLHQQLLE